MTPPSAPKIGRWKGAFRIDAKGLMTYEQRPEVGQSRLLGRQKNLINDVDDSVAGFDVSLDYCGFVNGNARAYRNV